MCLLWASMKQLFLIPSEFMMWNAHLKSLSTPHFKTPKTAVCMFVNLKSYILIKWSQSVLLSIVGSVSNQSRSLKCITFEVHPYTANTKRFNILYARYNAQTTCLYRTKRIYKGLIIPSKGRQRIGCKTNRIIFQY